MSKDAFSHIVAHVLSTSKLKTEIARKGYTYGIFTEHTQSAFYVNLYRAVIGPSG